MTTEVTNSQSVCENPRYSSESVDIEIPKSTFVCESCGTAMHFQLQGMMDNFQCSICDQLCGDILLVCDTCGLYICCDEVSNYILDDDHEWKSSCYNSYYDPIESVREQLYNQPTRIAEFNTDDQQHWLQCMWHDIVLNMTKFRTELLHASKVDTISTSNVNCIIENVGLEMTKGLVRLFIIFQNKLCTEIVEWFSSLIQNKRESLGRVAVEASVSLNGRSEQVKWLIQDLKIDGCVCELSGAVGIAAELGRLKSLEYLLEYAGTDPSVVDNYAIRRASRNGHVEVVDRLLQDERVDPSADSNLAIQEASENGHLAVVERLLQDERVDPSANDNQAIRLAIKYANSNIAKRLLEDDRVDPAAHNNIVIVIACLKGFLDVVELLLQDERVVPSARDNWAIRFASQFGYLHVVERLLQDDRVDPAAAYNDAILKASRNGHLDVVERLLLDDRVDPGDWDSAAIRLASEHGHLDVVERLLKDDRVDPSAKGFEAIRLASDDKIVECLYVRTRIIVCYMTGAEDLMKKLTPLHNDESLMVGGLCLTSSSDTRIILPQEVIFVILSEWATLTDVQAGVNSEQND